MNYIEETVRSVADLEIIKQSIIKFVGDNKITSLNLYFAHPHIIIIEVLGDEYKLKTILTLFNDELKAKVYDMFNELDNLYLNN